MNDDLSDTELNGIDKMGEKDEDIADDSSPLQPNEDEEKAY